MKSLIPKNAIKYSSEVYRYNFLNQSNKIYLILLLLLICLTVSLPLVKIDVYKSAPGIIKSEKRKALLIKSSDNIREFKNLDIHNAPYLGRSISEMSPRTGLFVECYVSPKEIGSVKNNQSVQFQIDVYDYRQWGMATGIIKNISDEISINEGIPVFKVTCSLNESVLALNEITKGKLKNGMTLKACFFNGNRSLFTLLFDHADNWHYTSRG